VKNTTNKMINENRKISKFEDLFIWQKARELTKEVYRVSSEWKDRSLQDQIRRAAVSVLSNISEGFERGTKDEFLYFLYIARGSAGEVRAQLYVAYDQELISEGDFKKVQDLADYESRLIAKFIAGYKTKSYGGQRVADPKFQEKQDSENYLKDIVNKSATVSPYHGGDGVKMEDKNIINKSDTVTQ